MIKKKCPYIYDLIASMIAIVILALSVFHEGSGNRFIKAIGICFLIGACILWIIPILHLKKYGHPPKGRMYFETTVFVRNGIYGILRHPQYLAYIFLVLGFALLSQHWLVIGLAALATILFYIHSREEDKELEKSFGDEFAEYYRRVPAFNFIRGWLNNRKLKEK